jgi:hypothetical protein
MEEPAAYRFKAEELITEDECSSFPRNVETVYQIMRCHAPVQVNGHDNLQLRKSWEL